MRSLAIYLKPITYNWLSTFKGLLFLGILLLLNIHSNAQIQVNSLNELRPYLSQSNVNVKLSPGVYTISAESIKNGEFSKNTLEKNNADVIFFFSGNNSVYDFTDVTINIKTEVFTAFPIGNKELYELQVLGNKNVLKNLTMVDVGSVKDGPTRRATNIVMDGASNRIEGFHITTKGSYPYGYGEVFGKGGKSVINHRKHSSFLIRGYKNHAKNNTIIHRSYGHAIFMQAADWPIIEGCYVEGVMRSTDDMWTEKGTGSDADKVNFKTVFGYDLPKGYMLCLGEEGIRAYNGGETFIDGVEYKRGTSNPTIINCTIKNMRAGVTLTHATGKKYVSGTTAIGCQRGFCIGTGDIVDCYADAQYGPALGVDYPNDSGMNAEITLLPYEGKSYNGSKHAAIIIGKNHNITLKNDLKNADQDLKINFGGDNRTIGMVEKDENYPASGIVLKNFTNYPIVLDDNSKNNTIETAGAVTDDGIDNKISKIKK
ncbi:pectin lyase fold protein [Formosa agariphila KMM 3901]|uniref:Pectin lyase fold protein n=1 Tax=Formosa agariphila (strain DSM 15362 / KCTC 12365 / LMG 23005 / KMM 3901 / M-2Alg 35-1) TaxID=1347342 RepID=T2KIK8_FORAG|nr:hypothetical protein [Formosa agariphila]CDF78717.1 pectin lyase fold protein [Formosa agariphila KMM 3901]